MPLDGWPSISSTLVAVCGTVIHAPDLRAPVDVRPLTLTCVAPDDSRYSRLATGPAAAFSTSSGTTAEPVAIAEPVAVGRGFASMRTLNAPVVPGTVPRTEPPVRVAVTARP